MNAFGLLFILGGMVLARQVWAGRVMETPADMRDLALAFLSGDTAQMQAVLSARGENVTAVPTSPEVAGSVVGTAATQSFAGNTAVSAEAQRLGAAASGYVLGATGPHFYDCSGLVWKAATNVGAYNGVRFTTSSFDAIGPTWCTKVTTSAVGDIILWPSHHMGFMVGTDKMYSARSPSKGIGVSTISGDSSYFGSKPEYWRINA